jgi:membrane protein required for beta-lactamase induction
MLDVYWRMKGVLVEVLLPIQFAVVLFSVRQMMVHRDLRARIDAERIYDKTIS